MNKKIISVILSVFLVFSALTFVGCGKKENETDITTDDIQSAEPSSTENTTEQLASPGQKVSDISEFDIYDFGDGYVICGYMGDAQLIEVPSEYEGQPVVGIQDRAFSTMDCIEKVWVPGSIKEIGEEAFMFCKNLTAVEIASGVETIGEKAFAYCDALESVSLSEGLVTIGDTAFSGAEKLGEIEIPSTVTLIESNAFSLTSIEKVVIPENVESVGQYAFTSSALNDVTIKSASTTIDSDSFGTDIETEMNISFHIVEGAAAESVLKEFNLNYDFI